MERIIPWLSIAIYPILAIALFWLKTNITNSVKHKYDTQIESIKSELREKEAKITRLQDNVLSLRAGRQSLLDKRRLEAVERLWACLISMNPYKTAVDFMDKIDNFEDTVQKIRKDDELQKVCSFLLNSIKKSVETQKLPGYDFCPKIEQLYVSPLAWAYFVAYRVIILSAMVGVVVLGYDFEKEIEYEGVYRQQMKNLIDAMYNKEEFHRLLKAALSAEPHIIDCDGSKSYLSLLDKIESALLDELTGFLEGKEADHNNITHAAELLKYAESALAEKFQAAKAKGVDLEALAL